MARRQSVNTLVKALKFDEPITIALGEPEVSTDGLYQVNTQLRHWDKEPIPSSFPRIYVTKGGKFIKRVEKFLRIYHAQTLTHKQKEELGNIVSKQTMHGNSRIIDFSHEIMTWPRGSFGNNGSCYRGGYKASVGMIRIGAGYGPGFVMRLFEPGGQWYNKLRGKGRAWLIPLAKNNLLLFNAYGRDGNDFCKTIINLLSEGGISNLKSKRVTVKVTSGMYVNNNNGFIVGKGVATRETVRLSIPKVVAFDCYACQESVMEIREGDTPTHHVVGDRKYCINCASRCPITGVAMAHTDMIYVTKGVYKDGNKKTDLTGRWVSKKQKNLLQVCSKCFETTTKGASCSCKID
jgi:hypothetical protein